MSTALSTIQRLSVLCVLLFSTFSHAQPLVNYQGRLDPPSTGLKTIAVSIYDAPVNGLSLWGPKTFASVPVVDGFFSVVLSELDDSGTNSLDAIGGGSAYVEFIADGVTNTPRQQILAVPRSLDGSPVGEITAFGGQTNAVPAGWLLCDGRAVSRRRYRALHEVLDDSWGPGDTNTTFNLPDLRGQFLRGADLGAEIDPDEGGRTNRVTTALQTGAGGYQGDEFKRHRHDNGAYCLVYPGDDRRQHYGSTGSRDIWIPNAGWLYGYQQHKGWTSTDGSAETRPKNVAVNYIIKY